MSELDKIINEEKEKERIRDSESRDFQMAASASVHLKSADLQTYVHLKASKEMKQRREILSKALVREAMEQVSN